MKRARHNSIVSPNTRRLRARQRCPRHGVAVIEAAIVISVFLVILLGTLDLGLAVLRYNVLSETSRRLARTASLRGERATPERTAWGPGTYTGNAGDRSEYAEAIDDILITMKPQNVQ